VGVGRRRRAVAAVCYGTVVVAAACLIIWNLPAAARFLTRAPQGFWVLSLIALVVDAPLYRVGSPGPYRVRCTLSAAAALAIFILWGAGPAILVQAVTATLSVLWQRSDATTGVAFVARHVCALAAAGFIGLAVAVPLDISDEITDVAHQILLPYALMALIWLVANFVAMILTSTPLTGRRLPALAVAARQDLLVVAATILLSGPLLHAEAGWWSVLAGLPLIAWGALTRARIRQDRRLRRETVTGTLNRAGLESLTAELTLYDYTRPERLAPFGVVVINVELVLETSRRFGRRAYEQLARRLADRLVAAYGATRVGRLSGEAMVIVLPGLTSRTAAQQARSVARVVGPPLEVLGIPFDADPAIGVALSPQHGRDFETLVANAELAMREARRRGLGAMVYGRQEMAEATRGLAILLELHAALRDPARRDEVSVVYQPQVEVASGRLAGAEALVRWTHPQWGPVRPDVFVAAIETSAVMHQLTLRVLDEAAGQMRRWNDRGRPTRVAVNVSVRDLHAAEFVDELSALVARHGVPASQLTIEVTERMVISADPLVVEAAERIRALGFGLALDDFGVGFASVDQLRTLPITEVKIDKSYVERVASSPEDRAIMRSLHDLAGALRLEMVAEGVEDEPTVAALSRLPGIIAQGYFFGRPMTASAFDEWRAAASRLPSRAHAR
jgi:diguanylate cyclase